MFAEYLAHALDKKIRYNASSGGFVKAMLCYLLDSKQVDYAIITRTGGKDSPLKPETIITKSRKRIISPRTNSVYMVHNPFRGLELNESKRYAMVCLPCQVEKAKCDFVICLTCNHAPLRSFTKEILSNLGVKTKEVVRIQYRGKGWPGYFTAYLKDGREVSTPSRDCWNTRHKPKKCQQCQYTGNGADLLVGDPRKTDKLGETLVVCLTEKGHQAVLGASDYIEATPVDHISQAKFLMRGEA